MFLLQISGDACPNIPVATVIVAISLCIGGFFSYIPQYVTLIRAGSAAGLSEKSLFLLTLSQGALVLNSLILNWSRWYCFQSTVDCDWWKCLTGLLSFFQISVNFAAAIPVWLIFLRFKLRDSNRACIYDLGYALTFAVIIAIALVVSLVEKSYHHNNIFFPIFAHVLGILSAVIGAFVWIPQIWKLIRYRDRTGLSMWMFLTQSIGGIIIVMFQAILYRQNWTTWIGYVFVCVEQIVITVILVIYRLRGIDAVITWEDVDNNNDHVTTLSPEFFILPSEPSSTAIA